MTSYRYVRTPAALDEVTTTLGAEAIVAVDTEAASFHKYRDRIYLVQLSGRTSTAIVDPLALDTLDPLGALLAAPAVEKVFHDADYDLRVLDRDYGFRAANVFDTRIAAQLTSTNPLLGLAARCSRNTPAITPRQGVPKSRLWSRRPLSEPMLEYAPAGRHPIPARAARRPLARPPPRGSSGGSPGRTRFPTVWKGSAGPAGDGPDTYLRLKGARALSERRLAALRLLHQWRERESPAEQDRATFRIRRGMMCSSL